MKRPEDQLLEYPSFILLLWFLFYLGFDKFSYIENMDVEQLCDFMGLEEYANFYEYRG